LLTVSYHHLEVVLDPSKMKHPDGIQVFIKNLNSEEHYAEYAIPEHAEMLIGGSMERFIEVLDGEKFAIVVKLCQGFKFYRAKFLGVDITVDQKVVHSHKSIPAAEFKDGSYEIREAVQCIDGKYMCAGLSFGSLVLGKHVVHCSLIMV
jgi:hypothetical protein